jgi:hypothetical protein
MGGRADVLVRPFTVCVPGLDDVDDATIEELRDLVLSSTDLYPEIDEFGGAPGCR